MCIISKFKSYDINTTVYTSVRYQFYFPSLSLTSRAVSSWVSLRRTFCCYYKHFILPMGVFSTLISWSPFLAYAFRWFFMVLCMKKSIIKSQWKAKNYPNRVIWFYELVLYCIRLLAEQHYRWEVNIVKPWPIRVENTSSSCVPSNCIKITNISYCQY